jgi:signal peptidase II
MKKIGLNFKSILLYIVTLIVVIGGDQLTKIIVDNTLVYGGSYTIIEDFFYFTYIHNKGAAWGMLEGKLTFFYIISFVAAIGIGYYFMQTKPYQKLTRFSLVLIFGGLVGNLIDRAVFGYVRDFIDFIIFGYNFPIFNIADIAITVGMFFILLEIGLEEYKIWKISKLES